MKSIVFAAVFSSALVFVLGQLDSAEQAEIHKKVEKIEEDAIKFCNELYPVSEDMHLKFARSVVRGEPFPIDLHSEETCHLNCYLDKLGFTDENGEMDPGKMYDLMVEKLPELKVDKQILRIFLFQTYRFINGMTDKCERAYLVYYRFVQAILMATIETNFHAQADDVEKFVFEVLDGKSMPKEFDEAMEQSLKNTELFFDLAILK
ncbi:uncharacterized protein LOC135834582 [Planococcus citri]|uniref:uncharacterized protein LOC135834582 n=1 Tax=Planococcus citri TaxID=170843 RepID=UPI0031F9A399